MGNKADVAREVERTGSATSGGALICFSHVRWDAASERTRRLMGCFATTHEVIVWEAPCGVASLVAPRLSRHRCPASGVTVLTPELPIDEEDGQALRRLLDEVVGTIEQPLVRWYSSPLLLPISQHVAAECVVYDCTENPARTPDLVRGEQALLDEADLVFTDRADLFDALRDRHRAVHALPAPADPATGDPDAAAEAWDRLAERMAHLVDAIAARAGHVQPIVSPTAFPSQRPNAYDVMVVGAGVVGAVMAEQLATRSGKSVLVVDRRDHLGGAGEARDAAGLPPVAMLERMLDHPGIDLLLGVDYREARLAYPHDHLVYTGGVDAYFDHRFGRLADRSPGSDHQALLRRYEALALAQTDVTFVGQPAAGHDADIVQVVDQALATYRRVFGTAPRQTVAPAPEDAMT